MAKDRRVRVLLCVVATRGVERAARTPRLAALVVG